MSAAFFPKSSPLDYRIISAGLFQPILSLSITRNTSRSITGLADLTMRSLGQQITLNFKIIGNYTIDQQTHKISLRLRGFPTSTQKTDCGLYIEMEMDAEWNTGIATYHYLTAENKIIKNATVYSILFTTMATAGNSLFK